MMSERSYQPSQSSTFYANGTRWAIGWVDLLFIAQAIELHQSEERAAKVMPRIAVGTTPISVFPSFFTVVHRVYRVDVIYSLLRVLARFYGRCASILSSRSVFAAAQRHRSATGSCRRFPVAVKVYSVFGGTTG
jgi:hypothetical protein